MNAGKYATTFLVVITSTLRIYHAGKIDLFPNHWKITELLDYVSSVFFLFFVISDKYQGTWESPWLWLWFVSCFVNSIYSYTWDIKMDWGLLDGNAGENRFLREEVVYSSAVS